MAGRKGATRMGASKLRSIFLSMASVVLFSCGPEPGARRQPVAEPPATSGEPAEPSAPVVRFSAQESGAPDDQLESTLLAIDAADRRRAAASVAS